MNVVLVEPEIPSNTGNIGRSCVATHSTLHLVGRLGFSLSDQKLKRAGLDYWEHLKLFRHNSWSDFLSACRHDAPLYFFEKDAEQSFWDARFEPESFLIFGSETSGFPDEIRQRFAARFYKIPMTGPVRSLNLSVSVAVALFEAIRQNQEKN